MKSERLSAIGFTPSLFVPSDRHQQSPVVARPMLAGLIDNGLLRIGSHAFAPDDRSGRTYHFDIRQTESAVGIVVNVIDPVAFVRFGGPCQIRYGNAFVVDRPRQARVRCRIGIHLPESIDETALGQQQRGLPRYDASVMLEHIFRRLDPVQMRGLVQVACQNDDSPFIQLFFRIFDELPSRFRTSRKRIALENLAYVGIRTVG